MRAHFEEKRLLPSVSFHSFKNVFNWLFGVCFLDVSKIKQKNNNPSPLLRISQDAEKSVALHKPFKYYYTLVGK